MVCFFIIIGVMGWKFLWFLILLSCVCMLVGIGEVRIECVFSVCGLNFMCFWN